MTLFKERLVQLMGRIQNQYSAIEKLEDHYQQLEKPEEPTALFNSWQASKFGEL